MPTGWAYYVFLESVELEDFFHHSPSMAESATLSNSNIIHEFNAINSIDSYIKS
jgi:hypothetical protein